MEKMSYLKAKNSYTNSQERTSFSMEIYRCTKMNNPNCKNDDEITNMLNSLMFNIYILTGDEEIGNHENFGGNPMITKDTFHS